MVKKLLGVFLVFCGLCLPDISVQALTPPDRTRMDAAAQDSSGAVWGIPTYNGNNDGRICRWHSGAWTAQAIPGAVGFRLLCLTRGDNGSVYALWQNAIPTPPQCMITVHHGIVSRLVTRFTAPFMPGEGYSYSPSLFAGAAGDVWLSGGFPAIWHRTADGTITTFPLKPDQYFDGRLPESFQFQSLRSLTDSQGRRWFWSAGLESWMPGRLRGVLIWGGKTLDYHATLPGLPERPFNTLLPQDTNHLWLSTAGDDYSHWPATHGGFYRIDTRTLTAVPMTPPQAGAFRNVAQISQVGNNWYMIATFGPDSVPAFLRHIRPGHSRKGLEQIEMHSGYSAPDSVLPWLAQPSGVWFGAGGGAWWMPREESRPAVWVDWRRGLGMGTVRGLFPLADGSILAFGGGGTMPMRSTPLPLLPLPRGVATDGLGAPKSLGPLLSDLRCHLWGTQAPYTGPYPLDEWDGKRWRTHLPPKSIPGIESLYACDSFGRLWLTTSNWNPPAQPQPIEGRAIYDPDDDTWTRYETVPDALQAAASRPGMAFLPSRNTDAPPLFNRDGRVTYNNSTMIFLYDGKTWRHWHSGDILTNYGGNVPDHLSFNQNGHLELTLGNQICEWTPENGWQRTGQREYVPAPDPVPPGGPRGLWAYPAMDMLGRKWFAWQGSLYTAWLGLWTKQMVLSGPGSPFWDGRGLTDVLCDPAGRLFFDTQVVWSPPQVPPPSLSVVPLSADTVTLRFASKMREAHWFLWRLNGGMWSRPQTNASVRLTALAHGDYRVEVQTLDSRLQPSASATAAFAIQIDPALQIARWVRTLLSGTDDAREAAVSGLVKQPTNALPALNAARSGASESARSWLDAAIQQIEDNATGTE